MFIIPARDLGLFALAAFLIAVTPGPNMIYLVSRALCQGWGAALISLCGVATGFLFHITLTAAGLTAVFLAVPYAYDTLRLAGALYLLWLAWQTVRPGSAAVFQTRELRPDSPLRLYVMGMLTNVLNPKAAVFYLSIFTQFLHPERGSIFLQSLTLGGTQIAISFVVNMTIFSVASQAAGWFSERPIWLRVQKWVMGTVLAALGLKLAVSGRR